ncbi:carbamoyltransferase C-terminal domain-containing protein [Sunxiuqinia elliptica]|uniref:Carbamoyltransferase n=1 Tax=Sunxiuqinia elliptica TaxID=655355 RepID=A0A4R6H8F4_9BACT|nr:carbamoyltransferase C-terminal domain-containing protein [Sunxiuqinia elliptica]TDO04693.1 carbamoyltransferase [Sunxiuqinia elliptica]TDO64241.1 carbamoyltransferase [Sunxiuqinia elliptica]
MNPNKPTLAIYGIQDRDSYKYPFYVHDHNLAIMQHGKVVEFLQLERVTRRKRDNSLHEQLYTLLKEKRLLGNDYDLVFVDNVVGRTFLSTQGNVRFEAPLPQLLASDLEPGNGWWFGKQASAWALNHELAHICSCLPFFGPFKPNSLLVHFDGGASKSNFSAWLYRGDKIQKLTAHWDYQYLTSLFNANALVFGMIGAKLYDQNSVPGKMMGLAGHGTYRKELNEWLKKHDYFQHIWNKKSSFFQQAKADFNVDLKSFDQKNSFLQDVIATLHELFVRETLEIFKRLQQQYNSKVLYYSGGCALNIVTNTRLVESDIFEEVYIPPCCEDSGLALGAAAYTEWRKHGTVEKHSPYLNNWNLPTETFQYTQEDLELAAQSLLKGQVIGVCNGFGEAGPRALGNRSLLCLADKPKLAQQVSMQHKKREWYRPVAPVMLEKNARYFTEKDQIHPLSEYMLLDFDIVPDKRSQLAGAVHIDGTARIQTIFKQEQNPYLFDLLSLLSDKYHVRALINTSFNGKGEPIVHTSEDALKSAQQMGIDGLILNGKFRQL